MALTAPTAGGGRAGRERVGMGGERVSLPSRPGASREPDARVVDHVGARRKRRERRERRVGEGDGRGHHRLVAEMESVRVRDEGERGRARGRTSVVRDEDLADDPRASSGEHIVLVLYLGSSHCGRGEGRVRRRWGGGREPSRLVRRPIVARTHRHGGEMRRVDALVPVRPRRVARLRRESHARAFAPPRAAPRVVAPSTVARATVGCSQCGNKRSVSGRLLSASKVGSGVSLPPSRLTEVPSARASVTRKQTVESLVQKKSACTGKALGTSVVISEARRRFEKETRESCSSS